MHQLEISGYWEWAIFVALHEQRHSCTLRAQDDLFQNAAALRTATVKQILQRNCPSRAGQQERDYRRRETFLLERLHLPKAVSSLLFIGPSSRCPSCLFAWFFFVVA
jgi:hypothetical protein